KMPYWATFYINPMKYTPWMTDNIIWNGTFDGKFLDKAHTINVFNQHIEEVKRYVPPERLLVYEVKQGWGPLCRFLDVPIPEDKPFPYLNDKERWHQRVNRRNRLFALVSIALPFVALFIGWRLFRKLL
ncbi:MAG: sulfotransferase, partial [Chloroflexota bacterium]